MNSRIFSISNLSCSYSKEEKSKVLFVKGLDIYKGEILFLLGASGSGKSTLLETLGLMNDTIADGDVLFYPTNANPVNLGLLWDQKREDKISDLRKEHLSFIFQSTNLMENFTAYENICLSSMIKDDQTQEKSLESAELLMQNVGLSKKQVNYNTLAVNLSGGQRQRVAFVRALNSNYSVLFCDEPTGNLDETNANELLSLIRKQLTANQTAIIVTHDINLALTHADRIIVITKSVESEFGVIESKNIYESSAWTNIGEIELQQFKGLLKKEYQANAEHVISGSKNTTTGSNFNLSYTKLFIRKEGRALLGENYRNIFFLVLMMSFTLISIGFGNGCLDYLEKKIHNPFVNWLTITIPYIRAENVTEIIDKLKDPERKKQFNYKSVNAYVEMSFRFWNSKDSSFILKKGRSVDMSGEGDPIMQDIMGKRNLRYPNSSGFRDGNDQSIIVTQRFLKELNYDDGINPGYVLMEVPVSDTASGSLINLKVPIQIKAVVTELPGKAEFLYTIGFNNNYRQPIYCTFDYRSKKDLEFQINGDLKLAEKIKAEIERFFAENKNKYSQYLPIVYPPDSSSYSFKAGYILTIKFEPPLNNYQQYDQIAASLGSGVLNTYHNKYYRIYDYYDQLQQQEGNYDKVMYDELSVNFITLDDVRPFSDYVLTKLNDESVVKKGIGTLEVDTTKIKEKENFMFMANITKIVGWLIIILGCFSVSIYIYNMLNMHLTRVKTNIGTFKAFGLSNTHTHRIYFTIILLFVIASLFISTIIALGAGSIAEALLSKNLTLDKDVHYFDFAEIHSFYAMVFIVITSIIVSWVTIRNLLDRALGDLIYSREKN